MRFLSSLFVVSVLLGTHLYGGQGCHQCHAHQERNEPHKCHEDCHKPHNKSKSNNDIVPVLRVEAVPRFFEDTAALFFLGEYGENLNRINAGYGFSMCPGNHLKFGLELLNEKLSYSFPYDHANAWVQQYAAAGSYQLVVNTWGINTLQFTGQWSHAKDQKVHKYIKVDSHRRSFCEREAYEGCDELEDIRTIYKRRIGGSKAYAIGAEMAFAPWYWAAVTAGIVYDRVDYSRQFCKNKIVKGVGATIMLDQRLTPCVSFSLRGEYRLPYSYYGGSIRWATTLYGGDFSLGAFAGRTIGQHSLPNSTVAGIEIGFDFGLSNYSETRSVGICWNSPDVHCQRSCTGQDREYLHWLSLPAVYIPEVLALSEQSKGKREHQHHYCHHHGHHGHHNHHHSHGSHHHGH